mmetsp:Transcript_11853/g.26965  ORF Transcript_11853/g.26965 Transcript_11853/m.26965 type:complete len:224 (-) Transcript_11853:451-1122(-)
MAIKLWTQRRREACSHVDIWTLLADWQPSCNHQCQCYSLSEEDPQSEKIWQDLPKKHCLHLRKATALSIWGGSDSESRGFHQHDIEDYRYDEVHALPGCELSSCVSNAKRKLVNNEREHTLQDGRRHKDTPEIPHLCLLLPEEALACFPYYVCMLSHQLRLELVFNPGIQPSVRMHVGYETDDSLVSSRQPADEARRSYRIRGGFFLWTPKLQVFVSLHEVRE